jgi:hypothetical protein
LLKPSILLEGNKKNLIIYSILPPVFSVFLLIFVLDLCPELSTMRSILKPSSSGTITGISAIFGQIKEKLSSKLSYNSKSITYLKYGSLRRFSTLQQANPTTSMDPPLPISIPLTRENSSVSPGM